MAKKEKSMEHLGSNMKAQAAFTAKGPQSKVMTKTGDVPFEVKPQSQRTGAMMKFTAVPTFPIDPTEKQS